MTSNDELMQVIKELRKEVAELKATQPPKMGNCVDCNVPTSRKAGGCNCHFHSSYVCQKCSNRCGYGDW